MHFQIKRGTNISHWLSQSQRRGAARKQFFQQSDMQQIAAMGCDHIRLPIDEEQMWDAQGRREPEAFDLLAAALQWAEEADLRVLVDLHILRSHHFNQIGIPALYTDPIEAERFAGLWDDLSEYLRDQPNQQIAYELLNEPVARDPDDWNRVFALALGAVRHHEKERQVFLGSNWYQSYHTFDDLEVPDDRYLTLSFHYYNPMLITHHQTSWTGLYGEYDGPIQYPGRPIAEADFAQASPAFREAAEQGGWNAPFDQSTIEAHLTKPLAVAARTGLPLYCGEFGVYGKVPLPIRQAWYRDVLAVFARHEIAWTNWDYRGSFGLFDAEGSPTGIHTAMGLGDP